MHTADSKTGGWLRQHFNNYKVDADMAPGDVTFESVDQIVTDQITNIESEFYDNKLLLKIYQNL